MLESQQANNIDMEIPLHEKLIQHAPFPIPHTHQEWKTRIQTLKHVIQKKSKEADMIRK